MTTRVLTAILCILSLILPAGCSDNSDPTSEIVIYDIVAFRGQEDGYSHFSISKPRSQETVTFTAQGAVINTELVSPGQSLWLAYTTNGRQAYTSGDITVKGYSVITNASMIDLSREVIDSESSTAEPVYLLSAWISENFLNLHLQLPYDDKVRLFTLARDTDSPDPCCPDLYLIHRREAQTPTFDRAYYVSYDISELTSDSSISGFTLHLDDTNLPIGTIEFQF